MFVCLSVCLSASKNVITFDPLHEINWNFQGLLNKKLYCWVGELAPWAPPPGPWSGKGPFPRTWTSLWVLVQWGHDIPCWKPIGKPNINFVTDFYFLPKIQNLLGVQNAGNEGAAKILDFELFFFLPIFVPSLSTAPVPWREKVLYTVGPHGLLSYFITDVVPGIL